MAELKQEIIRRKSIRKYIDTPFTAAEEAEVKEIIAGAAKLLDIDVSAELLTREEYMKAAGGMFLVRAPYYLIIKSEKKPGYLMNAGFFGQNAVLKLTAKGYGTCWLGGARPKEKAAETEYVISIALGRPGEPFRKDSAEAGRKPVPEIAYGDTGAFLPALNAARLAPSAMNKQPARFKCGVDKLDLYRKKPALPFLSNLQEIDCGIAAANIIYNEPEYKFAAADCLGELAGCEFMGTLKK